MLPRPTNTPQQQTITSISSQSNLIVKSGGLDRLRKTHRNVILLKKSGLSSRLVLAGLAWFLGVASQARDVQPFLEKHCVECHDVDTKKGGLDLNALKPAATSVEDFAAWVRVYDRVANGEMPPKKQARPKAADVAAFTNSFFRLLVADERKREGGEGRATQRRLNRYEYENSLRDLLHAPWLQVRDSLPEDGEANRFNKIGSALDVSHVQIARYLGAADRALRQVMATQAERPQAKVERFYAREQPSFLRPMTFSFFNTSPERATFPELDSHGQPEVRSEKAPVTVGVTNAEIREREGVGVVASAYEPIEPRFDAFRAPVDGRYKLRFNALSVWVGPGASNQWYVPDLNNISVGHRDEPVTVYSETSPRLLRWLGKFDVFPRARVQEVDTWLLEGETIRVDAARLFRSRPGPGHWQNPLAEEDGQPGVSFRWLEVEGPIYEEWPPAGHKLLFADLPMVTKPAPKEVNEVKVARAEDAPVKKRRFQLPKFVPPPGVEVISKAPMRDAERLLREFLRQACRRPAGEAELKRFLPVIKSALRQGNSFTDAMLAGYTAVLCSPGFLYLEEKPGPLDGYALGERLAYFLWNSPPDDELRRVAARGRLRDPVVLRAQTERLLADPKSERFVEAFLDYWLDLRKIASTAPDSGLYPDYYLDDLLSESALEETRLFFAELLHNDLPARNLVAADFAMLNERLARHYGLPAVAGVAVRHVPLPEGSPRGGLLTQASVLKVTANGTTTSPVVRGAWVMERILGERPPPPPPGVPAVEPDIRGAVTIRQQLDQHRALPSCSACHAKIDPAGFALENFDVLGGWRDTYRAQGKGVAEVGIGKGGQKFAFHAGPAVDASGELPDGRKFNDIREFKRLLLDNEKQIARNLARQLTAYATGAPARFSDRSEIEHVLQRAGSSHFGVRSLMCELVQSELFRNK
jgi:hypothetical protein